MREGTMAATASSPLDQLVSRFDPEVFDVGRA